MHSLQMCGAYLRLQVSVDVAKPVELVHRDEHLANVEPRDLLLEHARVVQEGPEVSTGDILHREVDVLGVLERIQQADKPRRLRRSEDIALDENMPDLAAHATMSLRPRPVIGAAHLVHLEQRPLAHLLERAHLPRIRLACEEHLSIPALSDLRDDLELVDLGLDAPLAEDGAFPAAIGLELLRVLGLRELPLRSVLVKARSPLLPCSDVPEEVEVVVQEVWGVRSD